MTSVGRAAAASCYSRLDIIVRPALVNGAAGAVTLRDGAPFAITGFMIKGRKIVEMDILTNPDRLRRVDLTMFEN